MEKLVALDLAARESATSPVELSALVRSDRESALQDWLEAREIEAAWKLVSALVSLDFDQTDIEDLAEIFNAEQLTFVLHWLSHTHSIYSLIAEIGLGTGRITDIVRALKSYTYMDQSPIQEVDLRQGIDDTLVILHSKLKAGIEVRKDFEEDLPGIQAQGSALNQVWTNIIDNAIDAMHGKGRLIIRAYTDEPWLVVEIEDDGAGIPEEAKSLIFDPFFTTKAPGEGTGLGLNISRNIIVKKHKGEISVASEPGRTCFTIRLPLASGAAPVQDTA